MTYGDTKLIACRVAVACVLVASGLLACGSEYPEEQLGHRIRGHIFYTNTGVSKLENPRLQVGVYADGAQTSIPQGFCNYDHPKLDGDGFEYEVRFLPAYRYVIAARLFDMDDPEALGPVGAYPNICAIVPTFAASVTVTDEAPTENIDFTLYDLSGLLDPCVTGR